MKYQIFLICLIFYKVTEINSVQNLKGYSRDYAMNQGQNIGRIYMGTSVHQASTATITASDFSEVHCNGPFSQDDDSQIFTSPCSRLIQGSSACQMDLASSSTIHLAYSSEFRIQCASIGRGSRISIGKVSNYTVEVSGSSLDQADPGFLMGDFCHLTTGYGADADQSGSLKLLTNSSFTLRGQSNFLSGLNSKLTIHGVSSVDLAAGSTLQIDPVAQVTVGQQSNLQTGVGSHLDLATNAQLTVQQTSKLSLDQKSLLSLGDHSTVSLADGAMVYISSGSTMFLGRSASVTVVDGAVVDVAEQTSCFVFGTVVFEDQHVSLSHEQTAPQGMACYQISAPVTKLFRQGIWKLQK